MRFHRMRSIIHQKVVSEEFHLPTLSALITIVLLKGIFNVI